MSELFTEELNFLKKQSEFFSKLKNDEKYLIQEINKLKDNRNELSELIKKYEGNLDGSVNIARYVLLQKLKCGENIEDNIFDILDEKYKSSDKDFWKDYIPENVINEKIANYDKNKPYQNWSLFGICHVFFYHGELERKVNEYLNNLSKRMLNDLNLENKKYSCETTDFVGSNHYGSEFLFIRFKPEFGSNQLSFVIWKGKMCGFSKKNKEDQKDEAKWYRKKSQQEQFEDFNSYNEIIEKLQTIRDEVLKANESNENGENTEMPEEIPLNQILYGPPGTGKTYNTIVEAIKIIDPEFLNSAEVKKEENLDKKYEKIKKKFDYYKTQNRIEFITFHQSYSYEEFVEGIKPAITENKDITYEVKDGIFKKISVNALFDIIDDKAKETGKDFERKITAFQVQYPEGSSIEGQTEGMVFNIVEYLPNSIHVITKSEKTNYYLNYDIFRKALKSSNKIKDQKKFREVTGIKSLASYYFPVYELLIKTNAASENDDSIKYEYDLKQFITKSYLEKEGGINLKNDEEIEKIPYVLIIDEINRGNISKIFGELITLIEEDKRLGAKHELTVKLPYSQDEFGIPKNLYIIGTMNTSDRSIASVDIALRRRFTFIEMMPKSNLLSNNVKGINLKELLETLNKRITVLLDRDHRIGHSYFLKFKKIEKEEEKINELKKVWFNSIIPLLNEYFYGDWEKLQIILGKAEEDKETISFIKKEKANFKLESDDCYIYSFAKIEDFKDKDNEFIKVLKNVITDERKQQDENGIENGTNSTN